MLTGAPALPSLRYGFSQGDRSVAPRACSFQPRSRQAPPSQGSPSCRILPRSEPVTSRRRRAGLRSGCSPAPVGHAEGGRLVDAGGRPRSSGGSRRPWPGSQCLCQTCTRPPVRQSGLESGMFELSQPQPRPAPERRERRFPASSSGFGTGPVTSENGLPGGPGRCSQSLYGGPPDDDGLRPAGRRPSPFSSGEDRGHFVIARWYWRIDRGTKIARITATHARV